MKRSRLLLMLALLVAADCRAPEPVGTEPIDVNAAAKSGTLAVRVGRGGITVEQLRAKLDALGAGKERYRDPKELRAFVDNQVRFELLADEALRRGLDRDPEVQEAARRTMVQKLVSQELETKDPSEAEVEKLYQQSIGDYRQPERVQIAAFPMKSLAEAELMVAKLRTSKDLAAVRKQYAAGEAANDSRYFSEPELGSVYGTDVARAVMAVKEVGTVGPIVSAPDKRFFVFKVTGRRAAVARPLSDVGPGIKQRLQRQKRNEAFEALLTRLRNEVPVTIDEAKLQEVWKIAPPASLPVQAEATP